MDCDTSQQTCPLLTLEKILGGLGIALSVVPSKSLVVRSNLDLGSAKERLTSGSSLTSV